MDSHQDYEELIEMCGPFVEFRNMRCRYGDVYEKIEVASDIRMSELLDLIAVAYNFEGGVVLYLSYSFNEGPYVRLYSDNELGIMMKSQLRCRAECIDIVIETDVGTSNVRADSSSLELNDETDDISEGEVFGQACGSRQRDASAWSQYIRCVGQIFNGGVKEFRIKLSLYAAELGFEYTIVKNKPKVVTAECKRRVQDGCQWRIHASVRSSDGAFVIKTLNNGHTCNQMIRQTTESVLNSKVLSHLILDDVRKNPGYTPKGLVDHMEDVYRFHVPYGTAYYALERAKKIVLGDGDASYNKLARYIELLRRSNPGSHCELDFDKNTRRFKRVFIALDACIKGFKMCRPLLCLDGTYLRNKYKGTLLIAVGKDANQGIYPLAYGVVGGETSENWEWFVEQLAIILEGQQRVISFITDRNPVLISAVREFFPHSPHAYCYHHMLSNLKLKFPGTGNAQKREKALNYSEKCAYAPTKPMFHYFFRKLLAVDAHRVYACLDGAEFSNWTNAYFNGEKYGDMCSNVAECFNSWVRRERRLPVTELIDGIRAKIMRMISKRATAAGNCATLLTPKMEKKLGIAIAESREFRIVKASEAEYEVIVGKWTYVVNVVEGICSCQFWRVKRFPCKHAVAVNRRAHIDLYPLIDSVFWTITYRMCYDSTVHPVVNDPYEIIDVGGPSAILPPQTVRPAGRPPTRRRRSRAELVRVLKCSRCGKADGHNRKTCTEPINV